jgi:hypothetical protein
MKALVGEKGETDTELWLDYMIERNLLEALGKDGSINRNLILQKE